MRRVVVVGNSGSGKSSLADVLAGRLGVPHVELDAHFHQAGWTPTPTPTFRASVRAVLDLADASADGWVVCGNYGPVRSTVWTRADTIVWLDLPRWVVMGRVTRRTLGRALHREELWNGNHEVMSHVVALHDPERSILRWAWDGVAGYRRQYVPLMASTAWADLRWHRLCSADAVASWLADVG